MASFQENGKYGALGFEAVY